jgi:EAL domain-containing protein (putative c-di-GMP-specific phosphodiesterase class I)
MGKNLKEFVIAEGIETLQQADFLTAQHCEQGQGFFFSRPLPAVQFAELMHKGLSPGLANQSA